MNVPRCRHIKANGTVCGSPALKDKLFCYHHHIHDIHHADCRTMYSRRLPLVVIEDIQSVQLALSLVINSAAHGMLQNDLARTLLYGLQVASSNARQLAAQRPEPLESVVRNTVLDDDLPIDEAGNLVDLNIPQRTRVDKTSIVVNVSPRRFQHFIRVVDDAYARFDQSGSDGLAGPESPALTSDSLTPNSNSNSNDPSSLTSGSLTLDSPNPSS